MPNFTNKAKLKKPLASEYFNIDDMNGNMDLIEQEFYTPKYSEELFNVDVDRFKVGTGIVEDIFKDYSNKMEQSLVTINNIKGKTEKNKNHLVSRWISSIASLSSASTNHFSKARQTSTKDATVTMNGNEITVTSTGATNGWAFADYEIALEIGKVYNFTAEGVTLNNGKSAIEIYDGVEQLTKQHPQLFNSNDIHEGVKNINLLVTEPIVKFRLHCTLDQANGEVKYKNLAIREVSDFNVTDIGLRSLHNGVNDVLKDGIVEKRVSDVIYFKDLVWYSSSTNGQDPNSSHYVYYAFPPNMKSPRNLQDDDLLITCNCLDTKPQNYTNSSAGDSQFHINCISAHTERSEVRVKLNRNIAPDLDTFNSWCNEGAYFQYELKEPTTVYVNTSLKCIEGDSVFISSPQTITCTHKVELNTKAQVEELQQVVQNEKKSVWDKFKKLTDVKMNIGIKGYIKLPTFLGGILIQWGISPIYLPGTSSFNSAFINYPVVFKEVFCITGNAGMFIGQNIPENAVSAKINCAFYNNNFSRFIVETMTINNEHIGGELEILWFAIGR